MPARSRLASLLLIGTALLAVVGRSDGQDLARTQTVLTSSPGPSDANNAITLTATITAIDAADRPPTGMVEFLDRTLSLGTAPIVADETGLKVSATLTDMTSGPHRLTAKYLGDDLYGGSLSNTVSRLVSQ
jgi:hypothetical protein